MKLSLELIYTEDNLYYGEETKQAIADLDRIAKEKKSFTKGSSDNKRVEFIFEYDRYEVNDMLQDVKYIGKNWYWIVDVFIVKE